MNETTRMRERGQSRGSDLADSADEAGPSTAPGRQRLRISGGRHRGGRIRQITRDQSFVQSLVEAGAILEEETAQSPYRNVILQAIGRKTRVEVALDAVELSAGDILLLCTDGLSDKVRPEEMAERLAAAGLREAVEGLIALANERGGEDNITALAGRIEA